jgi:DnaJ-like protein
MSGIPGDIPELGSTAFRLRQNPRFRPGPQVTTEDYYVWSRIDGASTTRDLILMTGFPTEKAIAILRKLRRIGALLLPDESPDAIEQPAVARTATPPLHGAPPPVAGPPPAAAPREIPSGPAIARTSTPQVAVARTRTQPLPDLGAAASAPGEIRRRPTYEDSNGGTGPDGPSLDLDPSGLDDTERAAMAEEVDVAAGDRLRILAMRRRLQGGDYFTVLGIARDTTKRDIKRVYFRLSKEFHPDRYYGKRTGSFGRWLSTVFETVNHAFETLSDDRRRKRYESELGGADADAHEERPQTPAEYAAQLFDRACAEEVAGRLPTALQFFAAAVRVDPQARYLRRAALAAASAAQLALAEEYASRAAQLDATDPSTVRTLGQVLRSAGKLRDAEAVLERARGLKSENDVLMKELAADLADVRRLLAAEDR